MIDLGISKIALIGAVALIVIGPEKLPRVARTVGALLGKAQRYVADVKAEVSRSMELEELKKMKEAAEGAVADAQSSIHNQTLDFEKDFEKSWQDANTAHNLPAPSPSGDYDPPLAEPLAEPLGYTSPKKNWRLKRSAMPQWYKARAGVRTQAQSSQARVARFRPRLGGGA